MKVLSIVSNLFNPLYSRLFKALLSHGVETFALNPRTSQSQIHCNQSSNFAHTNPFASVNLGNNSEFWRKARCRPFAQSIAQQLSSSTLDYDLIHAHTLSVDSYIAYELSLITSVPFCLTVRNCDMNLVLKYRFDLKRYHNRLLQAASGISSPNHSYLSRLQHTLGDTEFSKLAHKVFYTPNSIDPSFFNSSSQCSDQPLNSSSALELIHISNGTSNKNISGLLKALALYGSNLNYRLTFVGIPFSKIDRYMRRYKLKSSPQIIERATVAEIRSLLSNSDVLVNPSFSESFGLVYAEALSQSTIVVSPENEGLDRLVPFPYLLTCNPANPLSIYSAISRASTFKRTLNLNFELIRTYITQEFSPHSTSSYTASFYSSVLGK